MRTYIYNRALPAIVDNASILDFVLSSFELKIELQALNLFLLILYYSTNE